MTGANTFKIRDAHAPQSTLRLITGVMFAAGICLSSCAHQRGVVSNTVSTIEGERETHTALFFQKKTYPISCTTDRVHEFSVHQTPVNTLISVVTLGAVMPVEIAYVCAKDPVVEGSTDVSGFE